MLTSIEGIYDNGVVRLLEPLSGHVKMSRVVVTVLPDTPSPLICHAPDATAETQAVAAAPRSLTGNAVVDHYQPRTELGRTLIELRRAHVEQGGKLLSWDGIDNAVRERRGGLADD